ncbi:MAG: ion transporter [Proteobacteria bacterium]|nr:ion transporter [Pseudomonadota bacterium]
MKAITQRLFLWSQQLHKNPFFEWTTVAVIILSSLGIGVKSYNTPTTIEHLIYWLDTLITAYFLAEVIIRMIAAGSLKNFFRSGWNIFDFIIVTISLIPIDESEYALLARMLRLFRVMRLIYVVPQLRVLISALIKVIPRISYVALMMFIIFYMYGAVGNVLFKDINPVLWGDIGISMLTLFRVATLEDWTDVMYETMILYPLSWIYYLSFIFLSAFVFLNMMIGVIIESLNEEHNAAEGIVRNDQQQQLMQQLARIETNLKQLQQQQNRQEQNHRPHE